MQDKRERKYVTAIYVLMSLRLLIDPLLGWAVPNTTILRFAELLVMLLVLFFEFRFLLIARPFRYGGWVTALVVALGLICAGAVLRGNFSGGPKDIALALCGETRGLAYVLPFLILPLPNLKYFNTILHVMYFSALMAVPLWIINASYLVQELYFGESIGAYMPFFAAFLLGFIRRFTPRRRLVILALFFIYLLLMTLNARRNIMLSLTLYFVIAFVFFLLPYFKRNRKVLVGIFVASAIVLAVFVGSFGRLSNTVFSNVLERGLEDTRSEVEMMFLADMASSPATDVIFGRGMDGTYFQITQNTETYETETDRGAVETGYFNMVLKAGVVYPLVVVLLLLTAVVCGFRSKNREMCFVASFLLTYLFDMYSTNPVTFYSVRSIVFWFAVSAALQYKTLSRKITG